MENGSMRKLTSQKFNLFFQPATLRKIRKVSANGSSILSPKLLSFYWDAISKQVSSKRLSVVKLLFFLGNENDPVTCDVFRSGDMC